MSVPIFTSFGIKNSSQHSCRPRTLLTLICLFIFFLFFVSTRGIASIYIYIYRDIQIHQHFSLQRCSASFSAARPVFAATLGYDINHSTTSDIPWNWKSQCTRKMAASQSRTVHSKTHRVCPIHTRNIAHIGGPISSTIPSPWIESLCKGRSDMPCLIQRAIVQEIWLRPNHVRYIPRPTGSFLSTPEILDSSVQYPVLYHYLESSPDFPRDVCLTVSRNHAVFL